MFHVGHAYLWRTGVVETQRSQSFECDVRPNCQLCCLHGLRFGHLTRAPRLQTARGDTVSKPRRYLMPPLDMESTLARSCKFSSLLSCNPIISKKRLLNCKICRKWKRGCRCRSSVGGRTPCWANILTAIDDGNITTKSKHIFGSFHPCTTKKESQENSPVS